MFASCCPLTVQLALLAAPATVHVAPTGDDRAAGTASQPFATLARARGALRAAPRDHPRTVIVHGGVYRVTATLELGPADSGTERSSATWRAANCETVRLVGGARLTEWQPAHAPAVLARLAPAARQPVRQVNLKAAGQTDLGRPTPVGGPAAQLVCDSRYIIAGALSQRRGVGDGRLPSPGRAGDQGRASPPWPLDLLRQPPRALAGHQRPSAK